MNNSVLDVAIVGAGHAGLSAGYYLKKYGLNHVVFEQGKIGESWRSQRWDSFNLNTANKLNSLPGEIYKGDDPDGFDTSAGFVSSLEEYAAKFELPVSEKAKVLSVEKPGNCDLFEVTVFENNQVNHYQCPQVIIASGEQNAVKVPSFATKISPGILQLHTSEYRNPDQLPGGPILVVGSAQSGCQIAEDLADAGRKVYLSTSMVPRVPRKYRGADCLDWLIRMNFFDQRTEEVTDPVMLHMKPPQLTGTGGGSRTISLQALAQKGITVIGKMENADETNVFFEQNAATHVQFADGFSKKVKNMINEFIQKTQLAAPAAEEDAADIPDVNASCASSISSLDLKENNITSIIWATGFRGNFNYIKLPVLDTDGSPKHTNGISGVEGLYFLGLPWLRTRKSSLIYGISDDAQFISEKAYRYFQQLRQRVLV